MSGRLFILQASRARAPRVLWLSPSHDGWGTESHLPHDRCRLWGTRRASFSACGAWTWLFMSLSTCEVGTAQVRACWPHSVREQKSHLRPCWACVSGTAGDSCGPAMSPQLSGWLMCTSGEPLPRGAPVCCTPTVRGSWATCYPGTAGSARRGQGQGACHAPAAAAGPEGPEIRGLVPGQPGAWGGRGRRLSEH